ncbi:14105_t:CDS:2, partial [Racocetra persica]
MKDQQAFEKYLQEIEDPKNNREINYGLPQNPDSLQITKYRLCKKILGYKLVNNLTREQIAEKTNLSLAETEDILFCCIEKFTLDRLLIYAITITSHYKTKHGNVTTNELILEMLEAELNEEVLEPTKYQGQRKLEIKGLRASFEKAAKIAKKKPNELTPNDGENLQHEMKFLSERLGDEDNYEKLEELTNQKEQNVKLIREFPRSTTPNRLQRVNQIKGTNVDEGITANLKDFEESKGGKLSKTR